MHVLHRPHLHRALADTAIAAVVAIILTLALASALSHEASAPAPAIASSAPTAVQASAIRTIPSAGRFTRSPFTTLVTTPVTPPWVHNSR